jgi:hypothetical protein
VIDHQEIRQYADQEHGDYVANRLARYCLALLDENKDLKARAFEAEQKFIRAAGDLDELVNEYGNSAFESRSRRVAELEARLAKVPPLVEALREIAAVRLHHEDAWPSPGATARDALAAWEVERAC